MLLKLEMCIPMSYVTLEMVPKCANVLQYVKPIYDNITEKCSALNFARSYSESFCLPASLVFYITVLVH